MDKKEETLKELEKRTYLRWHRDGLADLGIGILVTLFGIGMKYDLVLLAPIFGCVGYPIWLVLKQVVTERRLGWVEFGEKRKRREQRGWTSAFILGCGILVAAIGGYTLYAGAGSVELPGLLMINVIFVVLASLLGIILQLVRMHIYSIVILVSGATGQIYGWQPEWGILLPGIIIVLSGIILLGTFLVKYPMIVEEGGLSGGNNAEQGQ